MFMTGREVVDWSGLVKGSKVVEWGRVWKEGSSSGSRWDVENEDIRDRKRKEDRKAAERKHPIDTHKALDVK